MTRREQQPMVMAQAVHGFSATGLPIGLQIVGREFEVGTVLRAGHAYQARTDWHRQLPPVSAE